jgi:hypothetical protein
MRYYVRMENNEIATIENNTTRQCGYEGPVGFTMRAWTQMIMKYGEVSNSSLFDVIDAARSAVRRAVDAGKIDLVPEFEANVIIDGTRQLVQCCMYPALVRARMVPVIDIIDED